MPQSFKVIESIFNIRLCSGFGGALFVQSASANVADCIFKYNFALTGQFDVGASGGAIVFIDVIDGNIQNATFTVAIPAEPIIMSCHDMYNSSASSMIES